jgi:hypothetical protein
MLVEMLTAILLFALFSTLLPVMADVEVERLSEGDGVNFPTVGQKVSVHYTGWVRHPTPLSGAVSHPTHLPGAKSRPTRPLVQLIDGKKFDSSIDRYGFKSSARRIHATEVPRSAVIESSRLRWASDK